ncbi:helix-turn-helix transcriptional regulator [Bifidobacterium sp. ESL0745]|uniref:helix-turn-helix domain-containing protein n=1 Tax=Bifidobacterium sp. ESL0745 TaxID=2983226 RepID=UPI0023F62F1D|nr:helix-turn-helix transcriptional regulator [Bifidobacterium sp. ESL0745]MDF7665692.1 helix-turn-helix transcriptional regulator [Bifidobacterium sp. ESL0745]
MKINSFSTDAKLNDYMRTRMRAIGVTQADMAKACGKTQAYISKHLDGQTSWRLDDIESLAGLFGFAEGVTFIDTATNYVPRNSRLN